MLSRLLRAFYFSLSASAYSLEVAKALEMPRFFARFWGMLVVLEAAEVGMLGMFLSVMFAVSVFSD